MLILAAISLEYMSVIISLVPLHKPLSWLILRIRIIGNPIFNFNLWGGSPDKLKELRNSVGNFACCESSIRESNDFISIDSPGSKLVAILLISSHFLFVVVRITLEVKSEL